jgi:hypothetical protein
MEPSYPALTHMNPPPEILCRYTKTLKCSSLAKCLNSYHTHCSRSSFCPNIPHLGSPQTPKLCFSEPKCWNWPIYSARTKLSRTESEKVNKERHSSITFPASAAAEEMFWPFVNYHFSHRRQKAANLKPLFLTSMSTSFLSSSLLSQVAKKAAIHETRRDQERIKHTGWRAAWWHQNGAPITLKRVTNESHSLHGWGC